MNEEFKDIFKDIRHHALTESERVSMRNGLLAHMAEHPAQAPLSIRLQDAFANLVAGRSTRGMRLVPATLAMILVVGVGAAYAAEDALPGDPLYAIKLNVNESLKGALAVSESAQAEWNTEKLERRLEEAEVLVSEGRLTPLAQATLEAEINATVEDFDKTMAKLAVKTDDAEVAAAQSDLEASLIGHAEVLVAITATSDSAEDIQPIIRSVLVNAEKAQAARASHEATVAAKAPDERVKAAALAKKAKAVEVLNAVRAKAAAKKDATSTAEITQETEAQVEVTLTEAERRLGEGDYGSAFTVFQEAIRTAKTAEVHLDASERLNADVKIFSRSSSNSGAGSATMMMMSAEPAGDSTRTKGED